MGWRDRDWARLSDDELNALYGVRRQEPAALRPTVSSRQLFWTLVVIACIAVAGLAYAARPSSSSLTPPDSPLDRGLLYGAPVTLAGTPTACTEIAFSTTRNGWACLEIDGNTKHLPVAQPPTYQGPCTHLVADQMHGRWECLGGTPLPPNELPSVVLPAAG